jgi:Lar family restriction alleviation protein
MDFDKNCKWHNDCGADMCHGEGVCPEFEKKLELLPCPFCGGVPSCRDNGEWNKVYDSGGAIVDVDISDPDVFIVECSCGAQIISDESEEAVYKAWNRRTRKEKTTNHNIYG